MKEEIVYGIARSGHNWMCNVIKSWKGSDYQVYDMESIWPWDFKEEMCKHFKFETYPEWPVYVLTRDYLNWAASWIKMTKGIDKDGRDMEQAAIWLDRWMAIHKEAECETNHIPNKIPINYDGIVQNREYRKRICQEIGGTYNEGILNFVPGQGSSFNKQDYQSRGQEMKVLERWKWFLTEEGQPYHYLLSLRPNVMEYYMEHWDLTEEQEQFCETILKKVQTIN